MSDACARVDEIVLTDPSCARTRHPRVLLGDGLVAGRRPGGVQVKASS